MAIEAQRYEVELSNGYKIVIREPLLKDLRLAQKSVDSEELKDPISISISLFELLIVSIHLKDGSEFSIPESRDGYLERVLKPVDLVELSEIAEEKNWLATSKSKKKVKIKALK